MIPTIRLPTGTATRGHLLGRMPHSTSMTPRGAMHPETGPSTQQQPPTTTRLIIPPTTRRRTPTTLTILRPTPPSLSCARIGSLAPGTVTMTVGPVTEHSDTPRSMVVMRGGRSLGLTGRKR
eukprot:Rmarinus@m.5173